MACIHLLKISVGTHTHMQIYTYKVIVLSENRDAQMIIFFYLLFTLCVCFFVNIFNLLNEDCFTVTLSCEFDNFRSVRVDPESVNSAAVDNEPQNRHSRLMVAAFVGLNPDGDVLVARDTTIMPQIPGLPALVCLLFTPTAELRSAVLS